MRTLVHVIWCLSNNINAQIKVKWADGECGACVHKCRCSCWVVSMTYKCLAVCGNGRIDDVHGVLAGTDPGIC